ncbi:MAG TPA: hypothetical protein VEZ90_07735 [Blastocatellia bacterium]|nr:hypothetical protein [Blastocatellia bacterium]
MMDRFATRKTTWVLTQDAFDRLLGWLDQDRERAGARYEEIRRQLIRTYVRRGCPIADELTDETINRVAMKLAGILQSYRGDPLLYFYGVANNVYLEYVRKRPEPLPMPLPDPAERAEHCHGCLEKCLDKITPQSRKLIYEYFREEHSARIECRRELSSELGISITTLRTRAFRIRSVLYNCVSQCVEKH